MTRKKNNELGQGKKKEKKAEKEKFFFLLTHKLHQFILGIRLHLKKGRKKRKWGGGDWKGREWAVL